MVRPMAWQPMWICAIDRPTKRRTEFVAPGVKKLTCGSVFTVTVYFYDRVLMVC